jgi:hypothetical protein
MLTITEERMSEHFVKRHIHGLPFPAVIHHFTSIAGENAHSHPFRFTSHVLKGGYTERVYSQRADGSWGHHDIERKPGTTHVVEPDCIHEIIDLPEGECYTLIIPEVKVQEPGFYRFDEQGAHHRYWFETAFKPI